MGRPSEVLLMIDANDTLQNQRSRRTTWVQSTNLIDIHMHYHGTDNEPATYARGTNRIDYFLATPLITNYVESCGILPLHKICFSDHRPLYAYIDLTSYLGGQVATCLQRQSRGVNTADPRTVLRYQDELNIAMDKSNLEEKVKRIQKKKKQCQETYPTTNR